MRRPTQVVVALLAAMLVGVLGMPVPSQAITTDTLNLETYTNCPVCGEDHGGIDYKLISQSDLEPANSFSLYSLTSQNKGVVTIECGPGSFKIIAMKPGQDVLTLAYSGETVATYNVEVKAVDATSMDKEKADQLNHYSYLIDLNDPDDANSKFEISDRHYLIEGTPIINIISGPTDRVPFSKAGDIYQFKNKKYYRFKEFTNQDGKYVDVNSTPSLGEFKYVGLSYLSDDSSAANSEDKVSNGHQYVYELNAQWDKTKEVTVQELVQKAQGYLDKEPMSELTMLHMLKENDGCDLDLAEKVLGALNADWNEQALKVAKKYCSGNSSIKETDLIAKLKNDGFTNEQATYGAKKAIEEAASEQPKPPVTPTPEEQEPVSPTTPAEPKGNWIQSAGRWWYRHSDGSYTSNGWDKIDGKWYLFDGSGWMRTGWAQVGNSWYYLTESGAMATGWTWVGGAWYYLTDSGSMATGWLKDGATWYYLSGSGAMVTGWLKLGNTWYYLTGSGAMATGWARIGNAWYYLHDSGAMATGWLNLNGTWYYLTGSGAMATGWLKDGNAWYYLTGSGAMATGWASVGGTWYYLSDSGAMATGWIKVDNKWYYLTSSGAMAANRWIDGLYWVGGNGEMATNAWVDGGRYWVDDAGRWQPQHSATSGNSSGWDGKTVYVTANGERWHKSANCSSLDKSNPISTTLAQVGSRTPCQLCAK